MFNLESDTDITPAPRKGSRWPPGDPQRESDPDGIMPPLMNPNCDMGKK